MLDPRTYEIHQLLDSGRIAVGLPAATKAEALAGLVGLLEGDPAVRDLADLQAAVEEREQMMSTGVGKGLALPHAKTAAVSATTAAFATVAAPVDFDAIDGEPVRMLFLLVGPEQARAQHLRLLSRISRLMNREAVREALLAARTPAEVLAVFQQSEEALVDA